ncbi:MAG: hypothetical protein ACJAS1_000263 [Oleiphilaceae bacterium]|jgi:hypothetical protein
MILFYLYQILDYQNAGLFYHGCKQQRNQYRFH